VPRRVDSDGETGFFSCTGFCVARSMRVSHQTIRSRVPASEKSSHAGTRYAARRAIAGYPDYHLALLLNQQALSKSRRNSDACCAQVRNNPEMMLAAGLSALRLRFFLQSSRRNQRDIATMAGKLSGTWLPNRLKQPRPISKSLVLEISEVP